MEYYKHDTQNSDLYNASFMYNCELKKEKDYLDTKNDVGLRDYSLNEAYSHMRCFKNPELESKLITDTYDLKYRCVDKEYLRKPSTQTYSDCLGYDCKYEANEFMYELDDFNTYHNYPVCKQRDEESEQSTCCPENIQVFNNLTRRNMSFPQSPKPKQDLLMDETKIPSITYHECRY